MYVLNVRNVNEALPRGISLLREIGVERQSRNGKVLMAPCPVATVYERPLERVLFSPIRDANPFFHFYESMWMLAGRNDVAPLVRYVKRMAEFSDDGRTFNAAYGRRWRDADLSSIIHGDLEGRPVAVTRGRDQLKVIADELRKNPDSRQCVLQIWDHELDLGTQTKDHACNLTATFQVSRDGALDVVMLCRSNDVLWGAYGANAVHMSYLLEYVASRAGYPVGTYTQISVNYHVYTERPDWEKVSSILYGVTTPHDDPYRDTSHVRPYPLGCCDDDWDESCRRFVTRDGRSPGLMKSSDDPFWLAVALPIIEAHDIYRDHDDPDRFADAMMPLAKCEAQDWRQACVEWLHRRHMVWREKH